MAVAGSRSCSANIYMPLDPRSEQIRVLTLHPGSFEEKLRCDISISTAKASFEALSYVWGDNKDTGTIEVQGETMSVTRNLEDALRHLRNPFEARNLWIDAVCINQKDPSERTQQVGMMGTIYRDAENVVVWLGAVSEGLHEGVLELIETQALSPDRHWESKVYGETDSDTEGMTINLFKLFMFLRDIKWYERIWTLQEAVLARSVTYLFGNHAFADGEIDGLLQSFSTHFKQKKCCDIDAMTMQHGFANMAAQISPYLHQISDLVDTGRTKSASPFLEIASKFRYRKATDPRDKIFGILGLTHDLTNDIIDYESTVADVYATAAIKLIEKTGNLDVLSHVLPHCRESYSDRADFINRPANLPSWAPDWNDNRREEYWRLKSLIDRQSYSKLFKACGQNSTPHLRSSSDGLTRLVLYGRNCGSILQIGKHFEPSNKRDAGVFPTDVLQEWRKMANVDLEPQQAYGNSVDSSQPRPTIIDAFWRTLCANIHPRTSNLENAREADAMRTRACHDLWWWRQLRQTKYRDLPAASMQVSQEKLEEIDNFHNHVISIAAGRRFFKSSTGLFGLSPQDAQEGDQIWVVNGGRVPLILRAIPGADNHGHGEEFTFLGDSYVHGIMQGEVIEMGTQETALTLI